MPELMKLSIFVHQVLVSNFDSGPLSIRNILRVMYEFLTAEKPYQSSYQPIAIYNNNIWDSPAIIRVVSVSIHFQFTESSRPDRLRTFSSHTMTLQALVDIGFWKRYCQRRRLRLLAMLYALQRRLQSHPTIHSISLDTCLADTTFQTLINQYKQKRRWAYNVEYYPHLVPKLLKLDAPFWDKMYKLFQYVEGNFNWARPAFYFLAWLVTAIFRRRCIQGKRNWL